MMGALGHTVSVLHLERLETKGQPQSPSEISRYQISDELPWLIILKVTVMLHCQESNAIHNSMKRVPLMSHIWNFTGFCPVCFFPQPILIGILSWQCAINMWLTIQLIGTVLAQHVQSSPPKNYSYGNTIISKFCESQGIIKSRVVLEYPKLTVGIQKQGQSWRVCPLPSQIVYEKFIDTDSSLQLRFKRLSEVRFGTISKKDIPINIYPFYSCSSTKIIRLVQTECRGRQGNH